MQRHLLSTQWPQGSQVLWLKNKPTSSPLHHHASVYELLNRLAPASLYNENMCLLQFCCIVQKKTAKTATLILPSTPPLAFKRKIKNIIFMCIADKTNKQTKKQRSGHILWNVRIVFWRFLLLHNWYELKYVVSNYWKLVDIFNFLQVEGVFCLLFHL